MSSRAAYTHGHHESVLRAHRWRTVDNSAAYILPGTTRTYAIKRETGPIPSGAAKVEVSFDDGTSQSYDVTVAD